MPDKVDQRPMVAYAGLLGIYALSLLGFLAIRKRQSKPEPLPITPPISDVALLAGATFKLSRLASKAKVTAPIRAPFSTYEESSGEGEVNEEATGHGLQRAVGELLTCPFCVSAWIATGLTYGLVLTPRATRLVMSTFVAIAISDMLHLSFGAAASILERLEKEIGAS